MSKLHDFTYNWWTKLLANEKLNEWLKKLYWAEIGGAQRFIDISHKYNMDYVLNEIIEDEYNHSELVKTLLSLKNIKIGDKSTIERYWDSVYLGVDDFKTACAAAAYGEMLARNRFKIILEHPDTPNDVRFLVALILPDEEEHAKILGQFAGKDAMNKIKPFHKNGMDALGIVYED